MDMTLFGSVRYRTNQLMAKASMATGLDLNKPFYICAKMTMRCNSRCSHCNIWKMHFPEPELSADDWFRILGELRSWLGRFRMVFTGGEALLRDDMCNILTHAVQLGISVELLSNGIIIDKKLASQVVATGIRQITLSYDGVTPEVHDRFRGRTGFHAATKEAILSLADEREKQGRSLRILLKTVISANNLHELTAIALWAKKHGLEIQYQPIEQNYGDESDPDWYRRSPLWIGDLSTLKTELAALRRMKTEGGSAIANTWGDIDFFSLYFERPEALMTTVQAHENRMRKGRCTHAVGNFVMESNGDVRMCFRMKPIGNVGVKAPEAIWRERRRCWTGPCGYW